MGIWRKAVAGAVMAAALPGLAGAQSAAAPRPDQLAFRAIYKELVEINTTLSVGSCTTAAQAMAARLKAAGYPDSDLHLIVDPAHPREGNLVAVLPGSDPKAKAVLLLAHIDVVEANRADWTRDPFTLIEEDGWFYARGASDDKAQASIWVDTMIRLKQEPVRPRRSVKMALTCGEESEGALNGADLLATKYRDLIDAGFALNEGAGGLLGDDGKPVSLSIQSGEKVYQDFTLSTTNPGGHSSRPLHDNAITHLAGALVRIGAHDFPVQLNETTRAYFTAMAPLVDAETGAAMRALVADPTNAAAVAIIARNPTWNSMLRTTCVATQASAGHAPNALPQRAEANVNCRIFPGVPVAEVQAQLIALAADPKITVTPDATTLLTPPPPPLTPAIMKPLRVQADKLWPGVPIVPFQSTGATDGKYLNSYGIPTYGLTGIFAGNENSGAHGLNERIRVKSLYDARDFLYGLVKTYAASK
ncbi:MAG: M20/M25/M40 family metallo-hydrolase [Caulobacter sp.]